MAEITQGHTVKRSALPEESIEKSPAGRAVSHERLAHGALEAAPLGVRLRYEEDVADAYRSWYKDQVVKEQSNELGRFLFGVSFATIGLLTTISKFSSPETGISAQDLFWLGVAVAVLLLSSGCSLYLAVPKSQFLDPNQIELVKLHKAALGELRFLSVAWVCLWTAGLLIGIIGLVF